MHLSRLLLTPMSRRFCIYFTVLVCSLCLFVMSISHHLRYSPTQEPSPILDIDFTEQSSTSTEVNVTNITDVINDVVDAQRLLIADEMRDYYYPLGRFNVSARSLADLTPETGGRPVRTIIITSWRSGSTFLGQVLNSHPANYFHYEPLLDYWVIQIRDRPLATSALKVIRSLLNCNYSMMDHSLVHGKDAMYQLRQNTHLWKQCQLHPSICFDPDFLNTFCKLFPFQSMKVIRLRLHLVEELLEDPSLNVRVVYMARDPRGTLLSRKRLEWCRGSPDCIEPERLCTDLENDYRAAVNLSFKFPHSLRVIRYEDLSVEPFIGVQELFKFLGLDFHKNVQMFLDTHTKVHVDGDDATFRNSKSTPFNWRRDLTFAEVQTIQNSCASAMDLWGYFRAINPKHQKTFNPLGEFKL